MQSQEGAILLDGAGRALQFLFSVVSKMCNNCLIESDFDLSCIPAVTSGILYYILCFVYCVLNSVHVRSCVRWTKVEHDSLI